MQLLLASGARQGHGISGAWGGRWAAVGRMPLEPDDNWGMSLAVPAYNTIEAILTSETAGTAHPFQASAPIPWFPRINHIVEYLNEHYGANLTLLGVHWSIPASFTQLIEWLQLNSPFDNYLWPYAKLGTQRRIRREAEDPVAASCADRLPAVPSIFSDDPRW